MPLVSRGGETTTESVVSRLPLKLQSELFDKFREAMPEALRLQRRLLMSRIP